MNVQRPGGPPQPLRRRCAAPRSWSARSQNKNAHGLRRPWAGMKGTNEAGLAVLTLLVLLAHVLPERFALAVAQLAVAVRVVLLQHLGPAGLTLRLHGLALFGVERPVVVGVELLQELRLVLLSALLAPGPELLPRRFLLLGIEDSVVVRV